MCTALNAYVTRSELADALDMACDNAPEELHTALKNLVLIPGMELLPGNLSGKQHFAIGSFDTDPDPTTIDELKKLYEKDEYQSVLNRIRDLGGIAIAMHCDGSSPFECRYLNGLNYLLGMEVTTGPIANPPPAAFRKWDSALSARKSEFFGFAADDAFQGDQIGRRWTSAYLKNGVDAEEGIVSALRKGVLTFGVGPVRVDICDIEVREGRVSY
jgi:hypothetical protein